MKRSNLWTKEQHAALAANFTLPAAELLPLINGLGPQRTYSAIIAYRIRKGLVLHAPKRGSKRQLEEIAARVALENAVPVSAIKGPRRDKLTFKARSQAMAEAYDTGKFSYPTIGLFFGGRDHTTAMNAVKQFRALAQLEAA